MLPRSALGMIGLASPSSQTSLCMRWCPSEISGPVYVDALTTFVLAE